VAKLMPFLGDNFRIFEENKVTFREANIFMPLIEDSMFQKCNTTLSVSQ
jgi:hypothetical protein